MTYQKITIPLDHGNRNMKTAEEVFTSGLVESDLKPVLGEYLQYNGKFYVCGTGRQTLSDRPGHSGARRHERQHHLADHRRGVHLPEISGKSQRHPDGWRSEDALHLHGVRKTMQVYFENPFCSLFALAIAVAEILLAALNARHRSHNCTLSDAIHEPLPAGDASWLTSDCLFERKMVCVPRPRAPCKI